MHAIKMETYLVLVIVLCLAAGIAADCGKPDYTDAGTINGTGDSGKCKYFITRNSSSDSNSTMLRLKGLALADSDILTVYDGNGTAGNFLVVNYTASSIVEFQVIVGFSHVVTIEFVSGNKSKSTWLFDYNTQNCTVPLQNTWISRVDSPLYLNSNSSSGEFGCTYIVESSLPADRVAAASLSKSNLIGNSILTLRSGNHTTDYKEGNLFADGTHPIVLDFTIVNTNASQNFSVLVGPVVEGCSGSNPLPFPWTKSLVPSIGYECRQLLHTNSNNSVILTTVDSLDFASVNDRLTLTDIDKNTGIENILTALTSGVKDYIITGSTNTLLVSLVLDNTEQQRNINITFTEAAEGGRFIESKTLSFDKKSDNNTVYYQLIAKTGQVVKVGVSSLLPENSTVTFYNGLQRSDAKLVEYRHDAQDLRPVIGGSNMLLELSGFKVGSNFSAEFTSIQPDCDQLDTGTTGRFSYSEQSEQICTWIIAPQGSAAGTIVINIHTLILGANDTMSIFAGLSSTEPLVEFKGSTEAQTLPPQIYVPVNDRVRISVSRAAKNKSAVIDLRYETIQNACGGTLSPPTYNIKTPNYPNQYPLNAACVWSAGNNSTSKFLYMGFQYLALAQNHSISVTDVVNGTSKVLASYGGVSPSLPEDKIFSMTKNLQVIFQSKQRLPQSSNQVGGGVSIMTELLNCGGYYTGSGSFASPNHTDVPESTHCIWIIDVKGKQVYEKGKPESSTNIVNFTIISPNETTINKYVKVFDGNSTRSKELYFNSTEHYLSLTDALVVVWNYPAVVDNTTGVFRLDFETKVCQADELCENGICIHPGWRCNGINDCGDNTDELNCNNMTTTVPPTPTTAKPSAQDYSGWVKSGWVPACLFIGLLLGALLVFGIPRIIRRFRTGGGRYSRMGDADSNT